MLRRFWQWLKNFFSTVFGSSSPAPETVTGTATSTLSDTDYEFLYMQLLEGVAHGWQADRIDRFFIQLGDRGQTRPWLDWLDRFGDRLTANKTPQPQLTARMMLLSQHIEQIPKRREIGRKSAAIAQNVGPVLVAGNDAVGAAEVIVF